MKLSPNYLILSIFIFINGIETQCNKSSKNGSCTTVSRLMEPFIVGGWEAYIAAFPHSMFLEATKPNSFSCGSSILNQWVLLTAAHCVDEPPDELEMYAYGGHEDLDKVPIIRVVDRFVRHYEYDEELEDTQSDIALLFMDCNLQFDWNVKRIVVSPVYPSYVVEASVAGWGMVNDYTREMSMVLKMVRQKIIDPESCETYKLMTPGTMCAGDPDSWIDRPSEGDSGSALLTSEFQQIGLVSHRLDAYPGLIFYTNVSNYYYWIIDMIDKYICVD